MKKPHLRARNATLLSMGIDQIIVSRRMAKSVLNHGPVGVQSLISIMKNTYRFQHKLVVDERQLELAIKQLIAEGDVVLYGDQCRLAVHDVHGPVSTAKEAVRYLRGVLMHAVLSGSKPRFNEMHIGGGKRVMVKAHAIKNGHGEDSFRYTWAVARPGEEPKRWKPL